MSNVNVKVATPVVELDIPSKCIVIIMVMYAMIIDVQIEHRTPNKP